MQLATLRIRFIERKLNLESTVKPGEDVGSLEERLSSVLSRGFFVNRERRGADRLSTPDRTWIDTLCRGSLLTGDCSLNNNNNIWIVVVHISRARCTHPRTHSRLHAYMRARTSLCTALARSRRASLHTLARTSLYVTPSQLHSCRCDREFLAFYRHV